MNATQERLAAMLTENCGTHFLDSGGTAGRHWQRNQGRDFDAEPETHLRFSTWERNGSPAACVQLTHSVYHWLAERLDFNPDLQARWETFCSEDDHYPDLAGMQAYLEHLRDAGKDPRGIYGEGDPLTVNTYNGEDLLSQTLQYVFWTDDEGEHVLLQIHGGADVRGGYSDAVAFDLSPNHELGILDNARAGLYVDPETARESNPDPLLPGLPDPEPDWRGIAEDARWYTDDGCKFYGEGADDLERYPIETFEEDEDGTQRDSEGRSLDSRRGRGALCIDDDGRGWCPLSGGLICGSPY